MFISGPANHVNRYHPSSTTNLPRLFTQHLFQTQPPSPHADLSTPSLARDHSPCSPPPTPPSPSSPPAPLRVSNHISSPSSDISFNAITTILSLPTESNSITIYFTTHSPPQGHPKADLHPHIPRCCWLRPPNPQRTHLRHRQRQGDLSEGHRRHRPVIHLGRTGEPSSCDRIGRQMRQRPHPHHWHRPHPIRGNWGSSAQLNAQPVH